MIGITRLFKEGGPLTKQISLKADGTMFSDGSSCVMSRGRAQRVRFETLTEFADMIDAMEPNEALALGVLRGGLPDQVTVTTQDRLAQMNGSAPADLIARNSDHIVYESGIPALALIDIDTKGMPASVKQRILDAGGFWGALLRVVPAFAAAGRVIRKSTSTGISRTDNDEKMTGSNGMHVYLLVEDGGDVERFLRVLHERCWLVGMGWHMVGAGGQLLDRSIVDRMVYAPERLVFEGAPVLAAPLAQDHAARRPETFPGDALNTLEACPDLTIIEKSRIRDAKAKSDHALTPERAKVRDRFVAHHAERLAKRSGMTDEQARQIIIRQTEGVILPDLELEWDDEELAGCTVADVLANPSKFEGATLADPLEGIQYGRNKAKILRRPDGSPWIYSLAHGRTTYELRYDAKALEALIADAHPDKAAEVFIAAALNADLNDAQSDALKVQVVQKTGVGKQALNASVKSAKRNRDIQAVKEARNKRIAERRDGRPQIRVPHVDAPWLPQMEVINGILGTSTAVEPPMRDLEGIVTQVRVRRVPNMHALTSCSSNQDEAEPEPATEQPLLSRLDEMGLAEMIERHIDYVTEDGHPVHLPTAFVKHFHCRSDDVLPTVSAIATLPIVLPDGTLLAKRGLDRERGIVFRVPKHLLSYIPSREHCTPGAVAAAMRFLTDDWLCDISTTYAGKCILIAAALTVIERSVLNERPAFFVTAGRRGGGKTTALIMLLMAVTGIRPSAAAWSPNEEERRKSLLSYLIEGLPAIIWDNIPRGLSLGCPHIEKSCTTAFYSDRRLGVSEMVSVSSAVVHMFTGNNIAPRGDLASRSLQVRLDVDRPDPENREFVHSDPIGWTESHRGEILSALYTVLLGNPALDPDSKLVPQTRFKMWWRIIGSAIEHAAARQGAEYDEAVRSLVIDADPARAPSKINFRDLFLAQDEEDEESASLGEALAVLEAKWPDRAKFKASDVAAFMNDRSDYQTVEDRDRCALLRDFFFPKADQRSDVSGKAVGHAMKRHTDNPVEHQGKRMALKKQRDTNAGPAGAFLYFVQ
jgi:hypothetical protein